MSFSPAISTANHYAICLVGFLQGRLFTGSERAGQRAAAIQMLLGTAKLNGLDPAAWLRDTLEKLPTYLNSQIDSLLPLSTHSLHPSTQ